MQKKGEPVRIDMTYDTDDNSSEMTEWCRNDLDVTRVLAHELFRGEISEPQRCKRGKQRFVVRITIPPLG
jgi:hypothetical protein